MYPDQDLFKCVFPLKPPLKIFKPLPQVKLLMFSKENSSEEISFTQPPQTEGRAISFRFKKEN